MQSLRQTSSAQLAALALLIAVAGLALIIRPQPPSGAPGASAPDVSRPAPARSSATERSIATLQERLRRDPADVAAGAQLGAAYLQRARETGDATYYTRAEQVLDAARRRDPRSLEVLIGQGALALARHDFAGALALGQQAQAIEPTVARVYGIVADAQIELGQYDAAAQTLQQMVDLRPDLASYSRVAYLRELHGDTAGAAEALTAALSAGGASAEATEWVRVQLGHLRFGQGDLAGAEREYRRSLAALPDYAPATAGLARVAAASGDLPRAVGLYRTVVERMPLPEYVIALGDLYRTQGETARAAEQYELVVAIDQLLRAGGVNTDMELALFMADHDRDLAGSLARARAAYAARPSVYAADALAWTLYKSGEVAEARRLMTEALRLGTQDALLHFHAGMIAQAAGDTAGARQHLQRALDINPAFSLRYADQAAETLARLKAPAREE